MITKNASKWDMANEEAPEPFPRIPKTESSPKAKLGWGTPARLQQTLM